MVLIVSFTEVLCRISSDLLCVTRRAPPYGGRNPHQMDVGEGGTVMRYYKSDGGNKSIWKKIKYDKKRGIVFSVVWCLLLLFSPLAFEGTYAKLATSYPGALFVLISFVLGFYNAYHLTMWIDHRISNTDFGIWSRRVVAGMMAVGGPAVGIVMFVMAIMITSQLEGQGIKFTLAVSFLLISILFASFFIGMGVFAGYIEFTHERRAGTIIFFGKSRY